MNPTATEKRRVPRGLKIALIVLALIALVCLITAIVQGQIEPGHGQQVVR